MELVTESPFAVGWMPTVVRPPRPSLLVVVKATFDLPASGECGFASEAQLPTGDVFFDDDVELPEDFRWEHYLAAPADQRIGTHWRGDEAVELDYLHPS